MTTTTDNGKEVSATEDEIRNYPALIEKMREQGYSPAETRQLLDDGWTQERIREDLLPPFDGDAPEKVEVEVDWGLSKATREPEKPEAMSDEQWEHVPDVLKPASPVELEERLLDGARSWHFVAGDLRNRRIERVIRNAMGCEEYDALEEHRLWGIPLISDVVIVVYPTPEGVGLSFISSADYEGEVVTESEVVPLDWIDNRGRQSQWVPGLAERLADQLGTGDVDAVKSVLSRRAATIPDVLDSYGDDSVEFFSHPDTGGLLADTLSVDGVFSLEDESVEYRIKMRAPDEFGLPGATATLTLDGGQWGAKSADAFKSAYSNAFGVELDLSDEMATMLFVEWDAMREMSTSIDLARETLVDSFQSAINSLSVTAADALESWESDAPAGILFTDSDGEDYIAVGSKWARDVVGDEAGELSRPYPEVLEESGLVSYVGRAVGPLYKALMNAEHVTNAQATVLVVPVSETAQDADAIRAVEDMDDDLTMDL